MNKLNTIKRIVFPSAMVIGIIGFFNTGFFPLVFLYTLVVVVTVLLVHEISLRFKTKNVIIRIRNCFNSKK